MILKKSIKSMNEKQKITDIQKFRETLKNNEDGLDFLIIDVLQDADQKMIVYKKLPRNNCLYPKNGCKKDTLKLTFIFTPEGKFENFEVEVVENE